MDKAIEYEILKGEGLRFNEHLSDPSNSKIILSGRFGSGKTTFLNVFFGSPEKIGLKSNFIPFRITPINYVIANNENILSYIKYDLITELLLKQVEVIENDLADIQVISDKDIANLMKVLLSMATFKGIDIDKIVDGLQKLKTLLDTKRREISETNTFLKYLDDLEEQPGLFENDIITKTLSKVLNRLKKAGKETVLIIDDFDRIDPEHIFRILNIFSSHFDEELYHRIGKLNKFDFDKVILVLDFDNLKSLFSLKFGQTCDFSGYIDKFYNKSVYHYDIRNNVAEYLRLYITSKIGETDRKKFSSELHYFARNEDSDFLERFILYSIQSGLLTFRKLEKLENQNIGVLYRSLDETSYTRTKPSYTSFQLKLVYFLFGNTENILEVLSALNNRGYSISLDHHLLNYISNIFDKEKDNRRNEDNEFNLSVDNIIFTFKYRIEFNQKYVVGVTIDDRQEAPVQFQIRSKYYSILFTQFLIRLRKLNYVP